MHQYVTLVNPASISSTTSVKKDDYYLVYNFEENSETKLFFNGKIISKSTAENYEIRYYPNGDVKKKTEEFKSDYIDSIVIFSAFSVFIVSALILGK